MSETQIDTGTNQLLCRVRDRVAVITMNRPEARNALSPDLSGALGRMIAERGADPEVGAILLTGAGNAFCAGGDVKRMGDETSAPQQTLVQRYQALRDRHQGIAGALYRLRIPTVAALPGAAAGAGMAIALSCDMRIAAENAFFSTGYARIGLSGDYGIAWLLTRVVGPSRARELMLRCERVAIDDAQRYGLVNKVVPADELAAAAFEYTRALANGPRIALGYIKDNLDEALTIDHATAIDREAERLMRASSTEDHKEAVRAFVEKRDPEFHGI